MDQTNWLEIAYWISQIILTVIAFVAAIAAWNQLTQAENARLAQLRAMNATLLMELDNRWDSAEMREARRICFEWTQKINETISGKQFADQQQRSVAISDEWTKLLRDCRIRDMKEYGKLMGMCGFFETVGLMVKKDYIAASDVIDLLKGPMLAVEMWFGGHIAEREKEMGVANGLYENALNLVKLAKA
ncbi:hypothetical protein NKH89_10425 [Mesorhizobium sp. M0923]|uniref:DUF4760 domain-containing protein n=1 Tax=Mesorhizobium sp. M0923 TaxID=2957028 RepID=UPI00333D8D06